MMRVTGIHIRVIFGLMEETIGNYDLGFGVKGLGIYGSGVVCLEFTSRV